MSIRKRVGTGIRVKQHPTRKHNGRPDLYYTLRFRVNGRLIEEALGWASEEDMNLDKARERLVELRKANRTNEGPRTLKEKRELEEEKRQAKEAEKERLRRESLTFGEFFTERYLPFAKESKKTWIDDLHHYNKHLSPRFGLKALGEISPLDIEKLKVEMRKGTSKQGKPYSPATIRHQIVLLKRLYTLAKRWGVYEGANPMDRVEAPRLDNQRTEYLSQDELARLYQTLDSWPCKATASFIKFALLTGLRRGEIFKLQWPDVDFERQMLTLQAPKGKKTQVLPISGEALAVLEGLDRTSSFCFPGKNGQQRTNFKGGWLRVRAAAGLPDNFRFHGLRHHFASALVSAGVDLYVVQTLLTHKSTAMTMRYAHLQPNAVREAAARSGKLLSPKIKEAEAIPIKA